MWSKFTIWQASLSDNDVLMPIVFEYNMEHSEWCVLPWCYEQGMKVVWWLCMVKWWHAHMKMFRWCGLFWTSPSPQTATSQLLNTDGWLWLKNRPISIPKKQNKKNRKKKRKKDPIQQLAYLCIPFGSC